MHLRAASLLALLAFPLACSSSPHGTDGTTTGAGGVGGTGGSGGGGAVITDDVARSGLVRDTEPDVPPGDQAAVWSANTTLAWSLYQRLQAASPGANLVVSPLSVSLALAMTYAGARNGTRDAMGAVLGVTGVMSDDAFHRAENQLDLALASRGKSVMGVTDLPARVRMASSLWGNRRAYEAPFLDTLAVSYGAGVRLADFESDAVGARQKINDWVSAETNAKIAELLPEGALTSLTKLVLVNAIWFGGSWAQAFSPEATTTQPFHSADGTTTDVPMMVSTSRPAMYAQGDGWQMASLLYDGAELELDLLVPDAGRYDEIEAGLDASKVWQMIHGATQQPGAISLPRFTIQGDTVSLTSALTDLGMGVAFDTDADFSGMAASGGLHLASVVHRATISVDETGTEAAGATAVVVAGTKSGPPDPTFHLAADRPFLFFVRDIETGAILFLGRYVTAG